MGTLREIRRRIKTVKSTQKITQAMYMIATTKLKKAESRVEDSRPFAEEMLLMYRSLTKNKIRPCPKKLELEKAIDNYPALLAERDRNHIGIIVVSSNKGLSGAYNANITRYTLERIREYKEAGKKVSLFIVGLRAYQALKRCCEAQVEKVYNASDDTVSHHEAAVIAEDVAEYYVDEKIDYIEIITTEYKSKLNNIPEVWPLLPYRFAEDEYVFEDMPREPEMIFEPNCEEVIKKILPYYLTNRIYQALLEAAVCEISSRMSAMKAATENAQEMIDSLNLQYNKARQATITQEILEVVAGANAI